MLPWISGVLGWIETLPPSPPSLPPPVALPPFTLTSDVPLIATCAPARSRFPPSPPLVAISPSRSMLPCTTTALRSEISSRSAPLFAPSLSVMLPTTKTPPWVERIVLSPSTRSVAPPGTSTSPRTVTSKSSGSRSDGLASRSEMSMVPLMSRSAAVRSGFVVTFGVFGALAFALPPATTASLARMAMPPPSPPESPAPPVARSA